MAYLKDINFEVLERNGAVQINLVFSSTNPEPQTISINNDYISSLPLHAKGWRVYRGIKRIR
jgi:hypothetical protein